MTPQELSNALDRKVRAARVDADGAACSARRAAAELASTRSMVADACLAGLRRAHIELLEALVEPDQTAAAAAVAAQHAAADLLAAAERAVAEVGARHLELQAAGAAGEFYQGRQPAVPAAAGPQPVAGPARGARLSDALKLRTPGRIRLEPGESVLGSGQLAAGTVRWVLTDDNGRVTARVGVGGEGFGSRGDEAGPWKADRDTSAADRAERARLRAEQEEVEQRLFEIDAAEKYAAIGKTYAELAAERDAARVRLDEIHEYDRRVTRAVQRYQHGNDYDGEPTCEEDQWLTGYCAPGEYDRLRDQLNALRVRDLPDPAGHGGDIPPGWPRPAEPGEHERLKARWDELDDLDTSEVYPSGYTARVDMAALDQLRTEAAPAIERARRYGAELGAYYDEQERLEAAVDGVVGRGRPMTDAEFAQLEADRAALEAHKATPEPELPADLEDGFYFGSGVVHGEWGDLHWRVEFDETASLDLGVVQHGQTEVQDLSGLFGQETAASLSLGLPLAGYDDPDEAGELLKQIDRVLAAGRAAETATEAA